MTSFALPIVLSIAVVTYKAISLLISKYLWNKLSILKDIPLLSRARAKKLPGVAVVCGGSVAGLFAARVCANHFEKVLIVEPEEWVAVGEKGLDDRHRDTDPPKRSRVAQYTAYHHFQLFMTSAMKEMFGSRNLEQAIRKVGARLTIRHNHFWMSGFPTLPPSGFPYIDSGRIVPQLMSLTRPAFETMLRRLVLRTCKEVQYFHGTGTGLVHDKIANRIAGVNVKLPDGDSTELKANIVIDATGSFMGGFRWLKAIPAFSNKSPSLDDLRVTFNPNVSYTTCEFALPPKLEEDLRKYGFPTDQDANSTPYGFFPRGGLENKIIFIEKREKNFLHIACGGYGWTGRVRSVGDIEDFVKEMNWKKPAPEWVGELLQALQRENVPASYLHSKFGSSVYIKYHEAVSYLPSNFVVVGDALSQTNPALGQGCPKACAHAIVLNSQLHRSIADSSGFLPRDFAQKYFFEAKDRTEHTWSSLKDMDYNYNTTVPLPSEDLQKTSRFLRAYSRIFFGLTTKDADLSAAFYRQISWIDPPTQLLAPWIVRRIAWAWFKQLFGYEIP